MRNWICPSCGMIVSAVEMPRWCPCCNFSGTFVLEGQPPLSGATDAPQK